MPDLQLYARLRALQEGRAQVRATHLQTLLVPHARVLTLLAMAGEDSTIHMAMWGGPRGAPKRVLCIPNPRDRDAHAVLLRELGSLVERYLQWCLERELIPQVWVSNAGAASHLDLVAERMRYAGQDAELKRLGELLSYFPLRDEATVDQLALVRATNALTQHWATGQAPAEDAHLGTVLAWIDPPAGQSVHAAVAAAARQPMGARTDPDFDRDVLQPLVAAHRHAGKHPGAAAAQASWAQAIHQELEPVARAIFTATQRAYQLLAVLGLPPLASLFEMEERERFAFGRFMADREAGYHIRLRDRPRDAARRFLVRAEAAQQRAAAIDVEDGFATAQALLDGRHLLGRVEEPQMARLGRARAQVFRVRTRQQIVAVRPGDEVRLVADPRLRGRVRSTRLELNGETVVEVECRRGHTLVPLPAPGARIRLARQVPEWGELKRLAGHLHTVLTDVPWTHDPDAPLPPARPAPAAQGDPLAAVARWRQTVPQQVAA